MIEWGDHRRPVGRWVPAVILKRFDAVADWLDGEVWTIRAHRFGVGWPEFDHKLERWDAANVIMCIVTCAVWAFYVGPLKAFTLGPLIYLFGWMATRWFVI